MSDAAVQGNYPFFSRLYNGASITAIQGIFRPIKYFKSWQVWFYPTGFQPNISKNYECRPYLPVRIFFPKTYDQTSPDDLPLIFTIHGGGFCIGEPEDDDEWNRGFSDMHKFLVVELNYSKAPSSPFPIATRDLEALMLAVMDDESLPIDKSRVAVAGFSAGGNLTLSVCQLPSIREKIKPAAAIPIYPVVDQSISTEHRVKTRHYKAALGPGMRGQTADFLSSMAPIFNWSYISAGQDLRDPLLSPLFAARDTLPRHIYIVAAELDQLGHEAWRMACKLAGRPEPKPEDKVGQEQPSKEKGGLILDNDRFAFQHKYKDGGTLRWLLVPDQVHGFDHLPLRWHGSEEAMRDAHLKTAQYQKMVGDWLYEIVWKGSASSSY